MWIETSRSWPGDFTATVSFLVLRAVRGPGVALGSRHADDLAGGAMIEAPMAVGVPKAVVHRAIERKERLKHWEDQHRRYEQEAVAVARRASERLLRCLQSGRLRVGSTELGPLESLPMDKFVEARADMAEVFVVFELRPGLAGRLRSITSRAWMADPDFVEAVGEGLRAAVRQHGLRLRFHPHWVQRFVPSGTGGYYQIVGFQLLARALKSSSG